VGKPTYAINLIFYKDSLLWGIRLKDNMKKLKQPKTIREFLTIYLSDRRKGKIRFIIMSALSVVLIITTISIGFGWVAPYEKSPDLNITYNKTTRNYGDFIQETKINISNQGDCEATDITIKITFPENTTIKYCDEYFNASYSQGILVDGGFDENYCAYRFETLDVNYGIPFTIRSHHPSFNVSNDVIVPPESIYLDCAELDWFFWNK